MKTSNIYSQAEQNLSFLMKSPSRFLRTLKRRGYHRYLASTLRGSLGAITKFAPPTKKRIKAIMALLQFIDFRVPGILKMTPVSEIFLKDVAECLGISPDKVGIYVGEPDTNQKLVIIDTEGQSNFVLKMAVGKNADSAIRREVKSLLDARSLKICMNHLNPSSEIINLDIPQVFEIEPICGKTVIKIERIYGKQLTSEEFKDVFFSNENVLLQKFSGVINGGLSIDDWLNSSDHLKAISLDLDVEIKACREFGALEIQSEIGIVHGDFAPWNVIKHRNNSKRSNLNNDKIFHNSKSLCLVDWEYSTASVPLVFDYAYAAWCISELLDKKIYSVDQRLWQQLVSLGSLWRELRKVI